MKIEIEMNDLRPFVKSSDVHIYNRNGNVKIEGVNLIGDNVMDMFEAMAFATTIAVSNEYEDNIKGITLMKRDIMEYAKTGMENALAKLGE